MLEIIHTDPIDCFIVNLLVRSHRDKKKKKKKEKKNRARTNGGMDEFDRPLIGCASLLEQTVFGDKDDAISSDRIVIMGNGRQATDGITSPSFRRDGNIECLDMDSD